MKRVILAIAAIIAITAMISPLASCAYSNYQPAPQQSGSSIIVDLDEPESGSGAPESGSAPDAEQAPPLAEGFTLYAGEGPYRGVMVSDRLLGDEAQLARLKSLLAGLDSYTVASAAVNIHAPERGRGGYGSPEDGARLLQALKSIEPVLISEYIPPEADGNISVEIDTGDISFIISSPGNSYFFSVWGEETVWQFGVGGGGEEDVLGPLVREIVYSLPEPQSADDQPGFTVLQEGAHIVERSPGYEYIYHTLNIIVPLEEALPLLAPAEGAPEAQWPAPEDGVLPTEVGVYRGGSMAGKYIFYPHLWADGGEGWCPVRYTEPNGSGQRDFCITAEAARQFIEMADRNYVNQRLAQITPDSCYGQDPAGLQRFLEHIAELSPSQARALLGDDELVASMVLSSYWGL